jgi:hypothetical protein
MVHSDSIINNTKKARRNKNAHFPDDLIYMIFQAKSTPAVSLPAPGFNGEVTKSKQDRLGRPIFGAFHSPCLDFMGDLFMNPGRL